MKNTSRTTIAALALWIVGSSCTVEEASLVEPEEGQTAEVPATDAGGESDIGSQTFAVGDTIELGDLRVVVNGVTDPQPPADEFFAPEAGNRFVSVDVTVENVGTNPEVFSSLFSFQLQDSEAFTYDPELFSDIDPQAPDGEIPPGGKKRGLVVFQIPEQAAGLSLQFLGELFTTGSAVIPLG